MKNISYLILLIFIIFSCSKNNVLNPTSEVLINVSYKENNSIFFIYSIDNIIGTIGGYKDYNVIFYDNQNKEIYKCLLTSSRGGTQFIHRTNNFNYSMVIDNNMLGIDINITNINIDNIKTIKYIKMILN